MQMSLFAKSVMGTFGRHRDLGETRTFPRNCERNPPASPTSPSPSSDSHTSLLISLTTHEGKPLHKSHYTITSAAAHGPIREAGKIQGYTAENKVKRFNSSLSSSALISREIYQLVRRRNQNKLR